MGLSGIQGLPPGMEFFFNGQRLPHGGNGAPGHGPEKRDTGSGFIVRSDGLHRHQ